MITIHQLTFGYKKNHQVLKDLNLEIKPGHIYGLLGKNGAGKSSLLHNIAGLLYPDYGWCRVLDYDPVERHPELLQQIYLLPEEFKLPAISIKKYLKIYSAFYPEFSVDLFDEFLKEFGISRTTDMPRMSYGEKKKVMISFALATRAKVLLMDEPTNGLDIPSKRQFRKIIAGALQDDQTIIISTHQVKDLDSLIDNVLVLDDKKIIINESIERITQKLTFKQVMDLKELPTPIYSEGALKGHVIVTANQHQENSKMDMEIFFNAVLCEKEQILPLFN